MNILILNWRDPKHPFAGGAEIALLEHAKYWQKKGAKITWFAASFSGAKKNEKINGIDIIRAGSVYTVHLRAFVALSRKMNSFDLVIDCFHFIPFFTPLYVNKKKIIAIIHEVAGEVWFKNLPQPFSTIGYFLEPFFFKAYTGIPFITGSSSAKEDVEKMHIPFQNIVVIHHGLEKKPERITTHKTKFQSVLFLGRVSLDKGIESVIHAYAILLKKYPSIRLFIAGKEEKNGVINTLLKKYKLLQNKNISIFGQVLQHKKYTLLKSAWVLLHASIKEGWGLTVIEANSVGTPVVGYNVAGLKDSIINRKTGLLVHRDAHSLAEGVIKLFSDKKLYENISKNALSWSKKFNWENSGQQSWELLYETFGNRWKV